MSRVIRRVVDKRKACVFAVDNGEYIVRVCPLNLKCSIHWGPSLMESEFYSKDRAEAVRIAEREASKE